jgi:hypothetical protein
MLNSALWALRMPLLIPHLTKESKHWLSPNTVYSEAKMLYVVDLNEDVNFVTVQEWAKENCKSFCSMQIIDPWEYGEEEFARFQFQTKDDAAWFKIFWMKWIKQ